MDRIELKNMGFFGYHGNLSTENELGQRFFVDVILYTDISKAGQSDNLTDSINYVEVYETVKRIVEGQPQHLLERLVTLIADTIMSSYVSLEGVEVTVRKPSVPIAGLLDYVAVSTTRGHIRC